MCLYLIASDETLSVVLIQETLKGQFLVYYVSKALHSIKLSYKKIEKLAYTFLMASRKLRQYFKSHHSVVLMDQPLKEVLQKMITSKRMIK